MDDNNSFLNEYKKRLGDQQNEPPAANGETRPAGETPLGQDGASTSFQTMHYEEKPTFVAPRPIDGPTGLVRKRRSKVLPWVIFIFVLVAITALLLWYFNRGTEVINLTRWTLNDAQLWATDNNVNLQVTEEYNDTFDAGMIFSQDQKPGSRLKRGGFLQVKVSLGHDLNVTLPLPDLLNMTMTEVEAWAKENFMTKVRITTEYHEQIAANRVIRFEINDATVVDLVKRSTPIYVIVSKGPEPISAEEITIPNFKEMSVVQSKQFAKDNDLVLTIIEQYDDLTPSGTIIDQSVAAEEKVDAGTEVILTVSLGRKILVPDFYGYSRERAGAIAAEQGITVTMKDRYSSRTAGGLISQSLEAGSLYEPGEVLELVYSLGNKIVLSSFVGQTRASIETWAKDLNEQGASIRISVTQTQNNAPRDTILTQDKANVVIGPDTTIRITVSLGKMVFMPDLVAPEGSVYGEIITREKATAACEAIGIIPVFVAETASGRLPGEVWHQSLAPGLEVYEGSTVTLKYRPVNVTIPIPDFTGMTQAQIISDGYLMKLDITFRNADYYVDGFPQMVFDQSIKVGEIVASGTAITLTISPEEPTEPTPTPTEPSETDPEPTPTETDEPSPTTAATSDEGKP